MAEWSVLCSRMKAQIVLTSECYRVNVKSGPPPIVKSTVYIAHSGNGG